MNEPRGIGPNHTSLLHKLSKKAAWELTEFELQELIRKEQFRRTTMRALGRVVRMMGEPKSKPKRKETLESLGVAPALITRLRQSGMSESKLIDSLRKAGLV